jgi:hypothetical protein
MSSEETDTPYNPILAYELRISVSAGLQVKIRPRLLDWGMTALDDHLFGDAAGCRKR